MKTKDTLSSVQDIIAHINEKLQSRPPSYRSIGKIRIPLVFSWLADDVRAKYPGVYRWWSEVRVKSELPLGNYGRPEFLILDSCVKVYRGEYSCAFQAHLTDRRRPDYVKYTLSGSLYFQEELQEWVLASVGDLIGISTDETFR